MKKLLQLEWLKIYNYKVARIFILLYCLFLFGLILLGTQKFNLGSLEVDLVGQGIFNYPQLWNFTTYFTALLKIFLAFIIITTVVNEFQNRTFKQNIIDGLSRKEFLLSKILTIVILSAISTILVFVFSLIFGMKYNTVTDATYRFAEVGFILAYFVKLVAFFMLCFFLSVIIRKSAFTFVLLFVWWFAEGILSGVERAVTHNLAVEDVDSTHRMITGFLPLQSMSNSIPAPIGRLTVIKAITASGEDIVQRIPWEYVATSAVYAVLFGFFSYLLIKKKDW